MSFSKCYMILILLITDSQVVLLVRKYLNDHFVEQILSLHKLEASFCISYGSSPKDEV